MKTTDLEMLNFVWRKAILEQSPDWWKVFHHLSNNFTKVHGEKPVVISSIEIRKELN